MQQPNGKFYHFFSHFYHFFGAKKRHFPYFQTHVREHLFVYTKAPLSVSSVFVFCYKSDPIPATSRDTTQATAHCSATITTAQRAPSSLRMDATAATHGV